MLDFKISAVSENKPLYANGVKEYKIKITESTPNVTYTSVKFNVISRPYKDFMELKGTFDIDEDTHLGEGETTVDISKSAGGSFPTQSIPLEIEFGLKQRDKLRDDSEVNLLIELVAGAGLGRTVPTPDEGFSTSLTNPYLSLIINRIQANANVNGNPDYIPVLIKELP